MFMRIKFLNLVNSMRKSISSKRKPKTPKDIRDVEEMMEKQFPHIRNFRTTIRNTNSRASKFPVKFPLNVPMSEVQFKKYKSYTNSPNSSYCFDFSRNSSQRIHESSPGINSRGMATISPEALQTTAIYQSLNGSALLSPENSMKTCSGKSFLFTSDSPNLRKRKSTLLCNKLDIQCKSLKNTARVMKNQLTAEIASMKQKLKLFKKHARLIEASNERAGVYMLKESIRNQKNVRFI